LWTRRTLSYLILWSGTLIYDRSWDNATHMWSSKRVKRSEILPQGGKKSNGMLTIRRQFGIPGLLGGQDAIPRATHRNPNLFP